MRKEQEQHKSQKNKAKLQVANSENHAFYLLRYRKLNKIENTEVESIYNLDGRRQAEIKENRMKQGKMNIQEKSSKLHIYLYI